MVLTGWLNFSLACFSSNSCRVFFSTFFLSLHSSMCCCRLSRDFFWAWMLLGMSWPGETQGLSPGCSCWEQSLREATAPRSSAVSGHGEGQLRACLQRGALRGSRERRADNPTVKRGEQRGCSAPGFGRDGLAITQRQEHCRAVFAFSILSVTKASRSLLAMAASASAPGVAGKEQGRMPAAVPTSPRPVPCQALTHHRFRGALLVLCGEHGHGLLQGQSLSPRGSALQAAPCP